MRLRQLSALAALIALAMPLEGFAEAPPMISYQGVLMQDSGIVVQDGLYNLQFRMFPQAVGGATPLFQQTLAIEVRKGLYNVILSNQGGFDLQEIFRNNAQLFMEVTVKANPPLGLSTDVVLQPRQQLVSVPFALATRGGQTEAVVSAPLAVPREILNASNWQTVPNLGPIAITVPAAACHLRVHASVTLRRSAGATRIVGVQLERSSDGTTFSVVRGPWARRLEDNDFEVLTASLEHIASDPPANTTYTYRVTVKEDNGQPFFVSPNVNDVGQTESVLEGQLWCP